MFQNKEVAAIFVFQDKEVAAILEFQPKPLEIDHIRILSIGLELQS